ncbi:MAG TPA: NAD(P)-dependent oxidoreductase [Gemmatimonadaceae bacterium]|nr:NAD(P)-dependent oxidoreductase [Gemmatimonadaceae bacterium]
MSLFPVMLHGEAIGALVVGGGVVGARKAAALLEAGAAVHVVAPAPRAELVALAAGQPRLRLSRREFAEGDLDACTLVVAATDSREVNARVARLARARRLPVNVVDAPEEGTFSTAAVHRAGELVVAVGAGGVPTAAARVRDAIAEWLDARVGDAVARLAALRARLLAAGDGAGWRRATVELTGADFVARVRAGTFAEQMRGWE